MQPVQMGTACRISESGNGASAQSTALPAFVHHHRKFSRPGAVKSGVVVINHVACIGHDVFVPACRFCHDKGHMPLLVDAAHLPQLIIGQR